MNLIRRPISILGTRLRGRLIWRFYDTFLKVKITDCTLTTCLFLLQLTSLKWDTPLKVNLWINPFSRNHERGCKQCFLSKPKVTGIDADNRNRNNSLFSEFWQGESTCNGRSSDPESDYSWSRHTGLVTQPRADVSCDTRNDTSPYFCSQACHGSWKRRRK